MYFSKKAEYGLRAIVVLAKNYPNLKSISEISSEENISAKYLEQIFTLLKQSKIIVGYKGASGGYKLSKNPKIIRVGQIMESLEGPIQIMNCSNKKCNSKKCNSKKVWISLEKQIKRTLNNIRLNELI